MRGVVNIGAHFVREEYLQANSSSPTIVDCLCEEILSVLFGTAGAKRTKNAEKEFRLCGGDEGFAPSTCANF